MGRWEEGQSGAETEGVGRLGTRKGAAGQNLIIKSLVTFLVGSINQMTTTRHKMVRRRHKTTT